MKGSICLPKVARLSMISRQRTDCAITGGGLNRRGNGKNDGEPHLHRLMCRTPRRGGREGGGSKF